MSLEPTQRFRRSLVGRGDLVAAIGSGDPQTLQMLVEQLGLYCEPVLELSPPAADSSSKGSTVNSEIERIESSGYPENIEPLRIWLSTYFNLESPLPPKPTGVAYVKWREQPLEPPSPQFLARWPEVGPRLRRGLQDHRPCTLLDLKKLVAGIARREQTTTLPRKRKRRWGGRVMVINDNSLRLTTIQADHQEIIRQLNRLLPDDCLTVAEGIHPYALYRSFTSPSTKTRTRLNTTSILPGTQVLVLSDLGCGDPMDEQWKAWLRWGKKTRDLGCRLVALCPSGQFAVPSSLRSLYSIQTWQRGSDSVCDLTRRSELLQQLFVLASPALRVEPGLLRELRLLLPERTDAGMEIDFWNSDLLSSNHPWGATLDYREVNGVLRQKFEQLDREVREEALHIIRHWRVHVQHAPEIWFEELLSLDPLSQSLFPKDLEDAYACFRELSTLVGLKGDDRAYMHRLTQRVPERVFKNAEIGDLLRKAKRQLHPEESDPVAGTDPRELPTGQQRRYELRFIRDRLNITSEHDRPFHGVHSDSLINASTSVLRVETESQFTASEFWKSGVKPDFVSAFGVDEYGAWFEFEVPRRDKKGVVTQRMRWIRAGSFMMGSPEDEAGRDSDENLHQVTLTCGFWLADTSCTQALWQAVTGKQPSHFSGDDRPVEQVSYDDVTAFCESLSAKLPGLQPQLPTEAQWEYACRAGTQTPFSFGNTISTDQANFDGNFPYYGAEKGLYREETVGVKDLPANAWGLYQMHGNVWEWCSDWYADRLAGPATDPTWPDWGSDRVVRGGSWFNLARSVRSACRGGNDPGSRNGSLGFRLLSSARAEPSELAEKPVAEQGATPARIGGAPEDNRDLLVRVDDQQVASVEIGRSIRIRVISNLEAVELRCVIKPPWAIKYGRDAFGVYGDFEVEDQKTGANVVQRLRWIPPGHFQMGSPPDEPGRRDNEPLHPVTISTGFWIFDAPCSQRLWSAIMDENPSRFKDPDRPVESVDWEQSNQFAERLSERVRSKQLNPLTFQLPTEAQWEYACRAGTSTAIYTGPLEILGDANAPALDTIAWYGGNSGHQYDLEVSHDITEYSWLSDKQYPFTRAGTRQLKKKTPNPWGLYDMLGNVWEWCSDWYADNPVDEAIDPRGPDSGEFRVVRGGGWIAFARYVRSACRDGYDPGGRFDSLGFRLLSSASSGRVPERVSGSRRNARDSPSPQPSPPRIRNED